MNNGAEAADQIVNMSLRGIEMLARISGAGAKNLATYLYAVLKDQKKTKGKTRLEGLLRSGKELKVFAVKSEDLRKFTQETKRYGVLYCALRDRKRLDGVCDIMVRAEDASKINRIVERFKLATVDTAHIKSEIHPSKAAGQEGRDNPNPTGATTEKSRPSEPTCERSGRSAGGAAEPEPRSVRRQLEEIRRSRNRQAGSARSAAREQKTGSGLPVQGPKTKTKKKKER